MIDRYMRIGSVTFGQTALPLPLSVRLSRDAQTAQAGGDNDSFVTSVQLEPPAITAEVRIRGTAVAETLALGQQGTLTFTILPARSGLASREVTLDGAILTGVDLAYEQVSPAIATLRFAVEADDGTIDPFSAEDLT